MPALELDSSNSKLVAPWWHTASIITLFLALAVGGALLQRGAHGQSGLVNQHPNTVPLYLSLIAAEWGLLYWVWMGGLRRTGTRLSDLIGGSWRSWKDTAIDVVLGVALWAGWTIVSMALDRWFGRGNAPSVAPLLPQRALEIICWILLSISAGICEEVVFRGYFQRQFQVFAHSIWIGWILQAVRLAYPTVIKEPHRASEFPRLARSLAYSPCGEAAFGPA